MFLWNKLCVQFQIFSTHNANFHTASECWKVALKAEVHCKQHCHHRWASLGLYSSWNWEKNGQYDNIMKESYFIKSSPTRLFNFMPFHISLMPKKYYSINIYLVKYKCKARSWSIRRSSKRHGPDIKKLTRHRNIWCLVTSYSISQGKEKLVRTSSEDLQKGWHLRPEEYLVVMGANDLLESRNVIGQV